MNPSPTHHFKIILDISLLGYVQDHEGTARGVHRVCQHLFKGLIESGECDLSLIATENLAGAHDLLMASGIPPEKLLNATPGRLRASRYARRAVQWVHRHQDAPAFPARFGRRAMAQLARHLSAVEGEFLPGIMKHAEIYHSPLEPIPHEILANTKMRHFLTVHDLIPLTHPETVRCVGVEKLKRQIGCLGPSSFAFCVSETVKSDLLSLTQLPPDHVFVTHLAADPETFYPLKDPARLADVRRRYGIPNEPYFLTLSAFDPRKNFEHVIRCFGELIESNESMEFNLVIVGANPHRNRSVAEALARNPKVSNRIILPGYVPDEDLAAVYSQALAFLFPSLSEGFGIPPLEAMQCGVPVIASNTTSIPEVIGDAGILLPPTSRSEWCQAILNLSRNETLRAKLSQQSLARAGLFSWQKFISETLRGYRSSLER